ncbi:hypothetical protein DRP05_10000 [Archaeoglobales archaeon]|nr:MAG: hypothetical protein DRP05_10000 [Archaeoglobales archaeon]
MPTVTPQPTPTETPVPVPDKILLYKGYTTIDPTTYFVGEYNGKLYLFGSYTVTLPPEKPGIIWADPHLDNANMIVTVDKSSQVGYYKYQSGYFDGTTYITVKPYCERPEDFEVEQGANAVFSCS